MKVMTRAAMESKADGVASDGESVAEQVAQEQGPPGGEPEHATEQATPEPAAEPAVDAAAESNPPAPPVPDWLAEFDRKAEFGRKLEQLKNDFVLAAQERAELEAELKEAKKAEKDALKAYNLALHRGPDSSGPAVNFRASESTAPEPPAPATHEPSAGRANAWRDASINELSGLPEKLREKLAEAGADTLGTLEDLRAQIAEGKAKWPKGIGVAKITQIEDAIIAWLSTHRDSYAFSTAQPAQSSDDLTEIEPPEAGGENDEEWIDAQKWEAMPEADKQAYLVARYRQLRGDDGNADWARPAVEGANYAGDGDEAFWAIIEKDLGDNTIESLLAASACPWHPCDAQDDWLRGFCGAYEAWLEERGLADDEDGEPAGKQDETQSEQAEQAKAGPAEIAALAVGAAVPSWIDEF